jgi:hypothetical protein
MPDGEAFLAIWDAVDLEELLVIIAVVPQNRPE